MMPPRAVPSWPLGKGNTYACFLSHYKKEAGAEARFIKDLIEPMLGEKVRRGRHSGLEEGSHCAWLAQGWGWVTNPLGCGVGIGLG